MTDVVAAAAGQEAKRARVSTETRDPAANSPAANSPVASRPVESIPIGDISFSTLIRKSVKHGLDMFVGNHGLKPADIDSSRRVSKAVKVMDEYTHIPSVDPNRTAAISVVPAVGSQIPGARDSKALALAGSEAIVAPGASKMTGMAVGASSDVLGHLTIRKTVKIPKPKWHCPWKLHRVIAGHSGWVRCVDVDPGNEWFVSGGADRLVKIWDLASGTLKLTLTGHINTVRSVKVSRRHPYLFSAGEDNQVKCWDLEYNKVIRNYHGHLNGVYSMTLHPAVDVLATGGRDAVVRLWDMRTRQAIYTLEGHAGTVMSLVSQKSEPQLISGCNDKMIRTWDIIAGKCSMTLTHHKKSVRGLAIHPSEYCFASVAADNCKIWKCPTPAFERNLEPVKTILNCCAVRDAPSEGAIMAAGSDQGMLHFWDWTSGRKFQTLESKPQPGSLAAENGIFDMCFDMSETRLITVECDKTIKFWREDPDATKPADYDR